MLRACHKVLKPGGRIAFFTYFARCGTGSGGDDDPSAGGSRSGEHQDMLQAAGFSDVVEIDMTEQFLSTAKAWYGWRRRYTAELIQTEGKASFSAKQSNYLDHVRSVEAGVRSRCLFLARRS